MTVLQEIKDGMKKAMQTTPSVRKCKDCRWCKRSFLDWLQGGTYEFASCRSPKTKKQKIGEADILVGMKQKYGWQWKYCVIYRLHDANPQENYCGKQGIYFEPIKKWFTTTPRSLT